MSAPRLVAQYTSAEDFLAGYKVLHAYVLRNPRLGLDEVIYAAKMSSLSPDALKFIAEHQLLPRVPLAEVRVIAKGQGRAPIVQAARKLVLNEH
jgi:hypothetical protein